MDTQHCEVSGPGRDPSRSSFYAYAVCAAAARASGSYRRTFSDEIALLMQNALSGDFLEEGNCKKKKRES